MTKKKKVLASPYLTDTPVVPCTVVVLSSAGAGSSKKFNRDLPNSVLAGLKAVRRWADRCDRAVLASGFSRGGRWLLQVACLHTDLIDFALVLAGYPTNKDWGTQDAEARAILKVPVPVDIVQCKDVFLQPRSIPALVGGFAD